MPTKSKKKTEKPVLIINTKKWGRGDYKCDKTGKMCALGFLAEQFPDIRYEFEYADLVIEANDNLSRQKRRDRLTEIFSKAGIGVKFV